MLPVRGGYSSYLFRPPTGAKNLENNLRLCHAGFAPCRRGECRQKLSHCFRSRRGAVNKTDRGQNYFRADSKRNPTLLAPGCAQLPSPGRVNARSTIRFLAAQFGSGRERNRHSRIFSRTAAASAPKLSREIRDPVLYPGRRRIL